MEPKIRITKRAVDAAQAGEQRRALRGSELKGFGLVVHPIGAKSYVVRCDTPSGRDRRMKLGAHGELTPDRARKQAADVLARVRAGHDLLDDLERGDSQANLILLVFDELTQRLKTQAKFFGVFSESVLTRRFAVETPRVFFVALHRIRSWARQPVQSPRCLRNVG